MGKRVNTEPGSQCQNRFTFVVVFSFAIPIFVVVHDCEL